jgi:hypothetical protein
LEKLSKSLEAIKTLKDDIGIEEIASNKSSLKLEQHAHEFFKIACKIFDVNAIVLLIDDVDMAFDKGFDVLEVVRKYLASPYLIPIVAGDMKLYREIIETKFKEKTEFFNNVKYLKDLNPLLNSSEEYKEKIKLLNNLVEQYLHKIFPQEYRIGLKDIFLVIRENKVTVRFENLDIPLTEIKDFEIRHINFGINQLEFIFKVFRNNTRKLIQYLTSKKEIYIDFFTQIDFPKDTKYQPYLPQNVIAKYDKSIISFMSSSNYKKSLEITYLNLKDEKKDDEESGLIKYLKNDLSSQFLINQEFQKLFQTKEIENGRYTIQYKNIDEVIEIQSKYSELENYIINLFIYNDYMTQHQTKNYIFSGKFVELIIFSLFIQDKLELDENLFQNIRKKIKEINFDGIIKGEDYTIYSIIFDTDSKDVDETDFKKDSNYFNELQIYKDFLELSLIANSTPFNSNRISEKVEEEKEDEIFIEYRTESLSRTLILWKNIFANNINLSSTALYRILEKFFANLNDMKSQRLDDNPLEFLQRIVLIFINSVAYFENTNIRIANTNIAIGSKFDISIALTKTNAAALNIKPLVNGENTLTKALFFHPIISHILFPNKDSKLNKLVFVGQNSKNNPIIFSTAKTIRTEQTPDEILFANGYKSGIGLTKRILVMKSIAKNLGTYTSNEIHKLKNSKGFTNLWSKKYDDEKYKSIQLEFKSLFGL